MSVLDRAKHQVGRRGSSHLIPEGATSVKAVSEGGGTWKLVFETPGGTVETVIGDMERAVKLTMRLAREIARTRT